MEYGNILLDMQYMTRMTSAVSESESHCLMRVAEEREGGREGDLM